MKRGVVRLTQGLQTQVEGLRERHLADTGRDISRATVVRILVRRALGPASAPQAVPVFSAAELKEAGARPRPPPTRGGAREEVTVSDASAACVLLVALLCVISVGCWLFVYGPGGDA
jgi:hypothetical protein